MSRCLALVALLALERPAHAYDVATSSQGAPLHWAEPQVTFTLAFAPGDGLPGTAATTAAAIAAIETWATELGDRVTVTLAEGTVAPAAHANDGINTIRWATSADDPDLERGRLGRTFLAYDAATGEIRDADIVLDAHDFHWTVGGACGNEYDLQSALTHELGHALGLAHSAGHPEATMFATGDACDTQKRDLPADDRAGLADLYAADAEPGGC